MTYLPRILVLTLFIVRSVFGQEFKTGETYFGVLSHHARHIELTFDEVSETVCSGKLRLHLVPLTQEPFIPFFLERTSTDTWKLSWRKQNSKNEIINELRLIETPHGPALVGNQLKPDSKKPSINSYDLGVIWLDPSLDTHPP